MKKVSLLPIIALVAAIVFSAFTEVSQQPTKAGAESWFYKGDDDTHYTDQTYFERLVDQNGGCNETPGIICVISADEDGQSGYPDLSTATVESYKP